MARVGRKRKDNTGLELRVYQRRGAYYYVHRDGRWEPLGRDLAEANRRAKLYNDPDGRYGTMIYWLDLFVLDCEERVKLKSAVKGVKLAQRTLEDYQESVGTEDKPSALRKYFKAPIAPLDVTPGMVQDFLELNARAGRSRRANLDRAALSACFGWLLRNSSVPGLLVNPCGRNSGVQRNSETKRDRYVTHEEYRDVFAVARRPVRLMMELTYRSLQRPESDIIKWDTTVVTTENGRRILSFTQNKTGQKMKIAFSPALEQLLPAPAGNVRVLREPIVRRQDGGFYTYDGLSSMLREDIAVANERRQARGVSPIESFGFRDLKGKGATDMYYLAKIPIETIQQLCGHASKTTTEIYIKQRWQETAEPNMVVMA